jgi:hypothetical protein
MFNSIVSTVYGDTTRGFCHAKDDSGIEYSVEFNQDFIESSIGDCYEEIILNESLLLLHTHY